MPYRSWDPGKLYEILNRIEGQIAAEDWHLADDGARDLKAEARYQKPVGISHLWGQFMDYADNLQIALRAQDREGRIEELARMQSTLLAIAGPEVKIVMKEES